MNATIIYFSNSGITEKLAMRIKKDTGADIIRVEPEKEYGGYAISIAKMIKEKITKSTRGFTNEIPDLSGYDTVFVGYPIWGSNVPQILLDFLKECDLSGKTVIPFSTAGASGIGKSLGKLKSTCYGAKIKYPYGVTRSKRGDYKGWMEKINDRSAEA